MMEICDSGSCLSVDGSLKDQVNYRPVRTTDVEQLKALHDELFPVKYSDKFYEDACRGIGLFKRPLYCMVVTIPTPIKQLEGTEINEPGAKNGNIGEEVIEKTDKYVVKETMIGFVLAQFMRTSECGDDDLFNSLFYSPPLDVFYILTIGVVDKYRGMRVGSTLLRMVYEHANANNKCGCVFLHVIEYNVAAIRFYQANSFLPLKNCSEFYIIEGQSYSSHLYIRYLHGFKYPLWYSPPLILPNQRDSGHERSDVNSRPVPLSGRIGAVVNPFNVSIVSALTNIVCNLVESITDVYFRGGELSRPHSVGSEESDYNGSL